MITLVLETGAGVSDANTYLLVADASAILDAFPVSYITAWTNASAEDKNDVLVLATRMFDDLIYFPRTVRTHFGQALHFPRIGMVDYDGYRVLPNTIPSFVKNATAQLALEMLREDRTLEPIRGISRASVGPLSVTFDTNQAHLTRTLPRSVAQIVIPWGGVVRGLSGVKSVPLYRV